MVLSSEQALGYGATATFVDAEYKRAGSEYLGSDTTLSEILPDSKLQHQLARTLYAKAHSAIMDGCDAASKSRLRSLPQGAVPPSVRMIQLPARYTSIKAYAPQNNGITSLSWRMCMVRLAPKLVPFLVIIWFQA